MSQGYISLLLHAHLPFVRHPEHEDFLEEDWLFEAITETYLPLVKVFDGLIADDVPFRLTMSMTPTLCAMLRDGLLQSRYLRYLERLVKLSEQETLRTRQDPEYREVALFYYERLVQMRQIYLERCHGNLVNTFADYQKTGMLEIITCAATHGFLPLMIGDPGAVRAQIMVARDDYRSCFGCDPRGIWLPECAYTPEIEPFLVEAGLRWFALDTHGIMFAEPRPLNAVYAPLLTHGGLAAFGRDTESGKQVWSAIEGYPGDPNYREFHRDVGYDLDLEYLRPYLGSGERKFTGLKYHSITGPHRHKNPYRPRVAREVAATHAGNFMFNREKQIDHLAGIMDRPPIVFSPYDAELFGHWWFEGPDFIDFFLRKSAFEQKTYELITPSEYLERHPRNQLAEPCVSTWGHKGYGEVWLDKCNEWIYPHLHGCAARMAALAHRATNPNAHEERILRQMARELMLAQSSDWAFIMKTGTTVEYATKRTKQHVWRFSRLAEQLENGTVDESLLANCEWRDNIFPDLDWRYYQVPS